MSRARASSRAAHELARLICRPNFSYNLNKFILTINLKDNLYILLVNFIIYIVELLYNIVYLYTLLVTCYLLFVKVKLVYDIYHIL
jgi:hypothetical protein